MLQHAGAETRGTHLLVMPMMFSCQLVWCTDAQDVRVRCSPVMQSVKLLCKLDGLCPACAAALSSIASTQTVVAWYMTTSQPLGRGKTIVVDQATIEQPERKIGLASLNRFSPWQHRHAMHHLLEGTFSRYMWWPTWPKVPSWAAPLLWTTHLTWQPNVLKRKRTHGFLKRCLPRLACALTLFMLPCNACCVHCLHSAGDHGAHLVVGQLLAHAGMPVEPAGECYVVGEPRSDGG